MVANPGLVPVFANTAAEVAAKPSRTACANAFPSISRAATTSSHWNITLEEVRGSDASGRGAIQSCFCSKEGTLAGQFYASQRRDRHRMHARSFANSLTVSPPDGYDDWM